MHVEKKEKMFCYYGYMINTNMEIQFITWLENTTYFTNECVALSVSDQQSDVHNSRYII